MFGRSKEAAKGETDKAEIGNSENGWDKLSKDVTYSGEEYKPMLPDQVSEAVQKDKDTLNKLRGELTEIQKKMGGKETARSKELKSTIEFIERNSPEGYDQRVEAYRKEKEERERIHEENQQERDEWEQRQQREEHNENKRRFGEDIGAAAARNGYAADKVKIEMFAAKIKRREEAERKMDPKERARAIAKREKEGLVWTDKTREIYRDIKENELSPSAREEYGRRKEQLYRNLSDIKSNHPFKFRKAAKAMGIKLPKKWDDNSVSRYELMRLNNSVSHLAEKK